MKIIIIILIIWIICGILDYGLSFAWYQRNWPTLAERGYKKDKRFCLLLTIGGPLSLSACYFCCGRGKYGFKFN